MKMNYDEIRAEFTGLRWLARVYRYGPMRMEWAYGETETAAVAALRESPEVIQVHGLDALLAEQGKGQPA